MFALHDAGARLNGLVAQIAQYPVSFKHDTKLAERVAAAVYLPDVDQQDGLPLKPMAASRTVRRFTGKPFCVWFDGGCPSTTGVGSIGMHFVDVDGRPLYTRGEHEMGYTSNHSEIWGLRRALETLLERGWRTKGDFIHMRGDSQYVLKIMTGEWRPSAPHLADLHESSRTLIRRYRLKEQF